MPATYADLLMVPEHLEAEIIDGELFTSSFGSPRHVNARSVLTAELLMRFDRGERGPGGWWIFYHPELHLGPDILVPDIAASRRDRMPKFPDVEYFEFPPDWLCEIVMPHTARLDRLKKLTRYARYGVDYVWLVDFWTRGLEVYRRKGEHFVLLETHEAITVVRAEPFDGADINLGDLWID